MSLEKGWTWSYDGCRVVGLSLGGIRTTLTLPEHKIGFDIGLPLPFSAGIHKFFITHGHMDHAGGIPYLISQKNLMRAPAPVFYMPEAMIGPMTEIIENWQRIEDNRYTYSFVGINQDSEVELSPHWSVKSFPTVHRIPSFGYVLIEKRKRLRADLQAEPREALISRRDRGEEIHDQFSVPTFAFTGDTQIEFLDLTPELRKARILFLEATYFDEKKSIAHAKEWGHTHLNEVIARLDQLECERIVLVHSSARHSIPELKSILKERIPREHQERVELFAGR